MLNYCGSSLSEQYVARVLLTWGLWPVKLAYTVVLQHYQSEGWVLFQVLLHLTTKEHPSYVFSDSIPSKQIVVQQY